MNKSERSDAKARPEQAAGEHEPTERAVTSNPDRSPAPPSSPSIRGFHAGAIVGVVALVGVLAYYLATRDSAARPSTAEADAATVTRLARPEPPSEGFVGSAACAECHAQIARRYAGHPMASSLAAVQDAKEIEDYTEHVRFAPTPRREYWIERKDGQVVHHDIVKGAQGESLAEQAVPAAFVIGSGKRGRSYLIRRDQFLFMSPISWYSAKHRWDLSPQYPVENHQGFERPATDRCLLCHAGRMDYAEPPTTELALAYKPEPFAETSIGCERCHGPGQEHVEFRQSRRSAGKPDRLTSDDSADPIVNPARLDLERQDAVCNQCHLQGDATVLRYGRLHGDFRPGDHVGDIWTVFVSDVGIDGSDETRAVSQVEQVRTSRCFQASQAKLTCTACHDPHEVPDEKETAKYYEQKCNACHAERGGCRLTETQRSADPARRDCIACHMPRLGATDVPHTVQTDHRILRDPSRSKGKADPNDQDSEPRIFDLAASPLTPAELDRAWGIRLSQIAEASRSVELAEQAQERLLRARAAAPDDIELLDALAITYVLQQRTADAVETWRSVLAIDPRRHSALFTLTVMLQNGGKYREASVYLEKLIEINPWLADVHMRQSQVLAKLGNTGEAAVAARRAQELAPFRPEAYSWLQSLERLQGNEAEVRRLDELLGKLRPPKGQSANE